MSIIYVFAGVCILLFFMLCLSIYFNIKHGILILEIQDSIEESLDVLDTNYGSISSILEKPIFFDSMEIRQVLSDIDRSRQAVLYIASRLSAIDDGRDDGSKKEN